MFASKYFPAASYILSVFLLFFFNGCASTCWRSRASGCIIGSSCLWSGLITQWWPIICGVHAKELANASPGPPGLGLSVGVWFLQRAHLRWRPLMLPGIASLSCLSFLSGRPFEPPCVSAAISGARLPFMRGGPDRFSPVSSTHRRTLAVVRLHNSF